jgi:AcrR family transcriptional regulator
MQKLVRDMVADDVNVRRSAVAGLVATATAAPGAIAAALALFVPASIESLSPEGRINALYFLARTAPLAWDAALYAQGRTVLAFLEQRARAGVAVGPATRVEMDGLARVLDAVRDGLPGPRPPG